MHGLTLECLCQLHFCIAPEGVSPNLCSVARLLYTAVSYGRERELSSCSACQLCESLPFRHQCVYLRNVNALQVCNQSSHCCSALRASSSERLLHHGTFKTAGGPLQQQHHVPVAARRAQRYLSPARYFHELFKLVQYLLCDKVWQHLQALIERQIAGNRANAQVKQRWDAAIETYHFTCRHGTRCSLLLNCSSSSL